MGMRWQRAESVGHITRLYEFVGIRSYLSTTRRRQTDAAHSQPRTRRNRGGSSTSIGNSVNVDDDGEQLETGYGSLNLWFYKFD